MTGLLSVTVWILWDVTPCGFALSTPKHLLLLKVETTLWGSRDVCEDTRSLGEEHHTLLSVRACFTHTHWMPIYPFIIDMAGPGHLGAGESSSRINRRRICRECTIPSPRDAGLFITRIALTTASETLLISGPFPLSPSCFGKTVLKTTPSDIVWDDHRLDRTDTKLVYPFLQRYGFSYI